MHHPPANGFALNQAVVFVPAFAEEMNKSRHVVAQTARRFAALGIGVLLIDLLGCGDSTGSLEDATWDTWRDDIDLASGWLHDYGYRRLLVWGMRLGGLLAAECAADPGGAYERCILWQPVVSGDTFLSQFLRLAVANVMLSGSTAGVSVAQLRSRLAGGETIEVAGYPLTPALAASLGLAALTRPLCPVEWFEVVAEHGRAPSPAALRVAEGWRANGTEVTMKAVGGESFWGAANAAELVQCPTLVEATASAAESWV